MRPKHSNETEAGVMDGNPTGDPPLTGKPKRRSSRMAGHRAILRIHFVFALASMVAALSHAASTGQISGTIQDSSGKPIPQATVAVISRFTANSPTPYQMFAVQVTTDTNGNFTVSDVPAGRFAVCPFAAGSGLLPPCMWEAEPTVTLAAGQSVAMQPIQLKAGVDVYVRVNDPKGTYASMNGKVAGASLVIGVRLSNGTLVHIPATASDATGFDSHLTVPVGLSFTLVAFSQTYKLTDANNAPINQQTGLSQPISLSTTQSQYSTAINIQ